VTVRTPYPYAFIESMGQVGVTGCNALLSPSLHCCCRSPGHCRLGHQRRTPGRESADGLCGLFAVAGKRIWEFGPGRIRVHRGPQVRGSGV